MQTRAVVVKKDEKSQRVYELRESVRYKLEAWGRGPGKGPGEGGGKYS